MKRVVVKSNGNREKGTNTWKNVNLKGEESENGTKLCENFNPYKSKIYISLSEIDKLFGQERDIFAPSYNNQGIANSQIWKSNNMPTLCGPSKNDFKKENDNDGDTYDNSDVMIEILPTQWFDVNTQELLSEITINGINVSFKLKILNE